MQIFEEYLLDSAMLEPHTKIVDSGRKYRLEQEDMFQFIKYG